MVSDKQYIEVLKYTCINIFSLVILTINEIHYVKGDNVRTYIIVDYK